MNKKIVVSVLVAFFVMVGLAIPAIAQTATDAVLILHFDEGSGTIAKDASGHGNDGTIHGATWTTGISGKALSFDGVDDYVDCGDIPLSGASELTVECWAKADSFRSPGRNSLVSKRHLEDTFWLWIKDTKAKLLVRTEFPYNAAQGTTALSTGKWCHIVGVWNGTHSLIYVNGVKENEVLQGGTSLNLPGNSGTVKIGHAGWDYDTGSLDNRRWDGVIDEVGIYSRALSPEEIKAHYVAKRAGRSTKESTSELISSVSTRIDALKRNNVDTSLIEEALKNAQNAFDLGNHDEAYELAQSAQKMADDAYEAQQHIESAQSEIDDAESIGAEVNDAEAKLKEAKDALNKGNYEYAQYWADEASELAKHASIGSVQIKDLKALATKYDERTVVISGTIRDIETVYGEGYTFALDDGSGMISVSYQGSLGDIKDGDRVTASGIFQASTGTVVADNVQKSGVGGVPGFEVIFAIAGLLAVAYLLRRRR